MSWASEVKHAAAVRMIARGCAHAWMQGRGRACGGGSKHLRHPHAGLNPSRCPIDNVDPPLSTQGYTP